MRTRVEKRPPAPVVADTAGTPANSCVPGKAREISVTLEPAAQPPAAEPDTRVWAPGETWLGLTCRLAAAAAAAAAAAGSAAPAQAITVIVEPNLAMRPIAASFVEP